MKVSGNFLKCLIVNMGNDYSDQGVDESWYNNPCKMLFQNNLYKNILTFVINIIKVSS